MGLILSVGLYFSFEIHIYREGKQGIKYRLSFLILISWIISSVLKYWGPPLLKESPKQLHAGPAALQQHILLHINFTMRTLFVAPISQTVPNASDHIHIIYIF